MKTTLEIHGTDVPLNYKWNTLQKLWADFGLVSPTFSLAPDGWRISESIEGVDVFSLRRDFVTKGRYTDLDIYGLLGLSQINLNDTSVILTEGVSDYFTAKLCNINENVLGVTNLGGSMLAKKILISLFDKFTVAADIDSTGIRNAFKWKSFLESKGKKVDIYFPEAPAKDITDEFIFNIKLQCVS